MEKTEVRHTACVSITIIDDFFHFLFQVAAILNFGSYGQLSRFPDGHQYFSSYLIPKEPQKICGLLSS